MKNSIIYIHCLLFTLFINIFPIFSQDNSVNQNNTIDPGVIIHIDLANPKIFVQNDDIYINVKIYNSTNSAKYYLISDDKKYCFDFEMVSMQNQAIEHSKDYIISFHRVQPVFNTTIRLESGEGYMYQVRLNDYFNLNITGQFYLKCLYYPQLKLNDSKESSIPSNQLAVNIRPAGIKEEIIKEEEAVEEEKMLYAISRSPDEVIDFTLNARMNNEWEKYFLYMDLNKLILTNSIYKQRYLKADTEKQKEIIKEYKEYLKKNTINEISFLPHKFEILKTEYSEGKGKVDVLVYYQYKDYTEKKYYTFFLNKKGNIWYIYSYEVLNLGIAQ